MFSNVFRRIVWSVASPLVRIGQIILQSEIPVPSFFVNPKETVNSWCLQAIKRHFLAKIGTKETAAAIIG
jgi:hypothetical protein